jgi:hypothetical protein
MKKLNLDFIGEIYSSPAGRCCWGGSAITFYGKFKDGNYKYKSEKYTRENLIEAVDSKTKPSNEYDRCTATQVIPERYLYIEDTL